MDVLRFILFLIVGSFRIVLFLIVGSVFLIVGLGFSYCGFSPSLRTRNKIQLMWRLTGNG